MNALLLEVLQWMQLNNYRRASFDRLIGIIPSASTYNQLTELVTDYPRIFRHATLKGGFPGLAFQDEVNASKELLHYQNADTPVTESMTDTAIAVDPAEAPSAPTVTESAVEQEIAHEYYRNLGSAVKAPDGPAGNVMLCVLVLRNGFVIVGKSACVHSENFDEAIGCRLAREDAIKQLWPFLGFRLADKRALTEGTYGIG